MKAAVFDGKQLQIKEVSQPKPSNSQVLVRVKAAGICGTDIAIVKGNLATPVPLILGHEIAGEIVELGKNIDDSWLGKRVTTEINTNIDFNCYYCDRELYSQCISRKALGIDVDGGFAEYIALESYLLHEIPSKIPFDQATFIEPLAAAYQTFETMPLDPDDKIMAIFGLGKLGLLILQVAKQKGLELIVVDGSDKKIELAQRFGARYFINRKREKDIPRRIREFTRGLGADIVLDASGNPEAFRDVVSSCRTRGKLHIKSTHGLATPVNLTDIVVRELTMYSSRCGPFEKAIEGLKTEKIRVNNLISAQFPLEKINEAFSSYEQSNDHVKTVLSI